MKKFYILIAFIFSLVTVNAQSPAMADTMRSEGKIYVVVAILVIILLGLIAFVALTDRKVSRIEKQFENKGK
jgi:K+-transporting ATPase A subunit